MTPKKSDKDAASAELPFGALPKGDVATSKPVRRKKKAAKKASKKTTRRSAGAAASSDAAEPASDAEKGEAAPRTRRKAKSASPDAGGTAVRDGAPQGGSGDSGGHEGEGSGEGRRKRSRRGRRRKRKPEEGGEGAAQQSDGTDDAAAGPRGNAPEGDEGDGGPRRKRRRRRRRNKGQSTNGSAEASEGTDDAEQGTEGEPEAAHEGKGNRGGKGSKGGAKAVVEGMFFLEKGQVSVLRHEDQQWMPSKQDIYVPKNLVQKFKLHDGMVVKGPTAKGFKHKLQLQTVTEIDGHPPEYWKKKPFFKNLTSIDPDFHYAVGDITDDVSMRVLDLIAPIGRGQRGLLVAPPRTGKTTLLRQFAKGIEEGYPDVHLMVLLIDERPEEATDWKRSVDRGKVFVSTADETAKNHINLAEVVWRRAMRLVEMGEDVVLLMDSITRLARAYNNQAGSGRTMSGGLDSRAMERPRKFFGSARNTVEAGSLTILGTTLVETGSRMDQLVFEEFKGTGNMELVLNRKLSDRRIFPSIDIEKSGTRKEEKLVGMRRLKLIHVLRRVLARMHFAEAAELLITKLDDVAKTDDFLDGFTVDPEA